MPGTGNIILKKGLVIPQGTNAPITLLEAMPAMQSVGLSRQTNDTGVTGYAYDNFANRLWMGMDSWGYNTTLPNGEAPETESTILPFPGAPGDALAKRPIWIGAEIRAFTPLKRSPSDTYFSILRADWKNPSDYIVATQKSIFYYIRGLALGVGAGDVNNTLVDGSFAILGSDGGVKGKQSFGSAIGIANYLELTGYSQNGVNKPATITTAATTAASIFDTEITDLSMGGAAEFIEIGDGSTDGNTATTVYGQLTVTGPTILSTDTVIDGGTF